MDGYVVGVDVGTTYTAVGVADSSGMRVLDLGDRQSAVPSVVSLSESGEVLVGETADRRSRTSPERSAREFKRRLGDPTPLLLAGTPYGAETLTGKVFRWIRDRCTERFGELPDLWVLAHPANWGPHKLDLLDEAARVGRLDPVKFVPEPVAAAAFYASRERVEEGNLLGVFDLGGGTFDAAVVAKEGGTFSVKGEPGGLDRFGGIDLDVAVYGHVQSVLGDVLDDLDSTDPDSRAALVQLREECRLAKEALSADTEVTIPVALPSLHTQVRLTREEFEDLVRPRLRDTIDAFGRAVASAGCDMDDLTAVLLVGGASRVPLISDLLRGETGLPVAMDAHPKHATCLGAALVGSSAQEAGAQVGHQPPGLQASEDSSDREDPSGSPDDDSDGLEAPPVADEPRRSVGLYARWALLGLVVLSVGLLAGASILGNGSDGTELALETTTVATTAPDDLTTLVPEPATSIPETVTSTSLSSGGATTPEAPTIGDDPFLDVLVAECFGGDFRACDELYWASPIGSSYEKYATTCGGLNSPVGSCEALYSSNQGASLIPVSASATSSADSSVDAAGNKVTYQPRNMIDGDPTTAWRTEGEGVGEIIQLQLSGPSTVTQVGLIPGYAKVDPTDGTDRFAQNRRVGTVIWEFDDGTFLPQAFGSKPEMQYVDVPSVTTTSILIEIVLTTEHGGRDFTAISEIDVRGEAEPQIVDPDQPDSVHVFPLAPSTIGEYFEGGHSYPATDIFAPEGTAFVAVTSGIVDEVSHFDAWDPQVDHPAHRGGLYVSIIGDDGVRYYGSHLSEVAPGIRAGLRVEAGQELGSVGTSGNAADTQPHLHFGISRPTFPGDWESRRGQIDPVPYLDAWRSGDTALTPVLGDS